MQEARKHRVEPFEPRVDAPVALESSEQPLDLIPQLVQILVVVPFDFPVGLRRHDRRHPQGFYKATGLVAFVGVVHRQRRVRDRLVPAFQQDAAFGRVAGLPAGQAKNHCVTVTCRNHADLRVPSAARFADALRPVLLLRTGAVGMHLDAGAVEAEALRQCAPLAAVLQDVQNRVDDGDVRNPHVPALNRKIRVDSGAMFRRDLFHECSLLDLYHIVDKNLSTESGKTQAKS